MFRLIPHAMMRMPSSFGWALVALDLHLSPSREIAILGGPDSDVARAALARWDPKAVVAFGPDPADPIARVRLDELICDGVHVHPAMVRVAIGAKRPAGIMET